MVLVRSGWIMLDVEEVRPDSLIVVLVHWELTTVNTLMMLVSDAICVKLYNYVLPLSYDLFIFFFCCTCLASPCLQGSVRLLGGTATQGRVEICNDNVWGTVCDNFWDTTDAEVICGQLGYSLNGML